MDRPTENFSKFGLLSNWIQLILFKPNFVFLFESFRVGDLVLTANGISFENVDYSTAVRVLRDCGNEVHLMIKRPVAGQNGLTTAGMMNNTANTTTTMTTTTTTGSDLFKVTLSKSKKKDDFGIQLGCRIFIKELSSRLLMDRNENGGLQEGDVVLKINNTSTENLTLKELRKLMDNSKEKLSLVIRRSASNEIITNSNNNNINNRLSMCNGTENVNPMGNGFGDTLVPRGWNNQNLYVQPPTRGKKLSMKSFQQPSLFLIFFYNSKSESRRKSKQHLESNSPSTAAATTTAATTTAAAAATTTATPTSSDFRWTSSRSDQ